jgi:hypothetical protein
MLQGVITRPACIGPGLKHPATHTEPDLCDFHYNQRRRAISAYTTACSRVPEGEPKPDREAFITGRYAPLPDQHVWLSDDQLNALRDAERELRIAEAHLSKVTSTALYGDMTPREAEGLAREMTIAADNAIKVIKDILGS